MSTIKTSIALSGITILLATGGILGLNQYQHQTKSQQKTELPVSLNSLHSVKVTSSDFHTSNFSKINQKSVVKTLSTNDKDETDSAFNDVAKSDDTTTQTQTVDGVQITSVTNDDNTVAAVKVTNDDSKNAVTFVNDGSNLVITRMEYNEATNQYNTEEQEIPLAATTNSVDLMNYSA